MEPQSDVYKTIFADGRPFTQGPVSFQEAILKAKEKNIFVNTIFCGRASRAWPNGGKPAPTWPKATTPSTSRRRTPP